MKTNQNGYAEIVSVAIILGIIGALFITGVFIWQKIQSNNNIIISRPVVTGFKNYNESTMSGCQKSGGIYGLSEKREFQCFCRSGSTWKSELNKCESDYPGFAPD